MQGINSTADHLVRELQERKKELNCIYQIEELLTDPDLPLGDLLDGIIKLMPPGMQFPELAQAKITFNGHSYMTPGYVETVYEFCSEIKVQGERRGFICVSYSKEIPPGPDGYFLKEEFKLINTIADRISILILHKELKSVFKEVEEMEKQIAKKKAGQWKVIVDLLKKSDRNLYIYIFQKMLYYLVWNGVQEANQILEQYGTNKKIGDASLIEDANRPSQKKTLHNIINLSDEVFRIASENLSEEKILENIERWVEEDKSRFLIKVIDNLNSSRSDIIDAITRYNYIEKEGIKLTPPIEKSLRVSLVRHFFSEQLEFINIAKKYIEVRDYYDLVKRIIFPPDSYGRLGGKSSGLFLAYNILSKDDEHRELFNNLKVPKTWYITSDSLMNFIHYNNLEGVMEQKYKEMDEIHVEYQNIIQIFKNSYFPPEIIRGLSIALDDLGDKPIIVRSSSLLEDRLGSAFSGKYKSLFLANQGSKEERLDALMDAIAEVYASTFGPDPIEYRLERGLLDFHEEMGIMIQEVVGTRIGDYFLPSFAGVAFSNNEFRWSARIKREDGLIRIVPGLGTRAVDRIADDYPILIAPGKPDLRVNVTPEEIVRYSTKKIDIINLVTNTFQTVDLEELLEHFGNAIPGIQHVLSIYEDGMMQLPTSLFNMEFENKNMVVTFEGLFSKTPFIKQIDGLLKILQKAMGTPVDIEFAHDGKSLYLLQCRPQCYSDEIQPAPIPQDVPADRTLFTADKYISNGAIPDITHIVFVDPEAYSELSSLNDLKNIGRAVGKLNKLLPKRQFILMGPGRWGSRGDIKLGVDVTYSDINNSAVLIEVALKKGNYVPDLSFGTHFFQDLVEAKIRYIPLYPDDTHNIFNDSFLLEAPNILADILPEYSYLEKTIHVIDVPQSAGNQVLRILMNSDLNKAIGFFTETGVSAYVPVRAEGNMEGHRSDDFWRWRVHMAEKIADQVDAKEFGIKGLYIFGSAKNATAGPASDIDLLVHFDGTPKQKENLLLWLKGWSLCLAEMNFLRTGYRSEGLLDIHLVTDEDIANKSSFAVKINAITDAARQLRIK